MEFVTTLVGVLLGAGLTWLVGHGQRRSVRRRESAYLSIRIVVALDELVVGCARAVGTGPYGDDHEPSFPLPTELRLPTDGNWESLDPRETAESMRLAAYVGHAFESVRISGWYDPESGSDQADDLYTAIALRADRLATDLRKKYKISERDLPNNWDPLEQILAVRGRINERATR
ncbi:hypothetical protein [Myceligenerans cantabricum]